MKLTTGQRVHYESGPNMTPLVDVVMVILIFLMLAGSFAGAEHYLQSQTSFASAQLQARTGSLANQPIEVSLTSPAPDRYVARVGDFTAIDRDALVNRLTVLHQQLLATGTSGEDIRLIIRPDTRVKYRFLIEAYEAALQAKFDKVGFGTSPN